MGRRKGPPTAEIKLRLPEALKAHFQDQAAEHGRSLNEEVKQQLVRAARRRPHMPLTRDTWDALMALEPGPDDPRTDQEIARQMDEINPYRKASA